MLFMNLGPQILMLTNQLLILFLTFHQFPGAASNVGTWIPPFRREMDVQMQMRPIHRQSWEVEQMQNDGYPIESRYVDERRKDAGDAMDWRSGNVWSNNGGVGNAGNVNRSGSQFWQSNSSQPFWNTERSGSWRRSQTDDQDNSNKENNAGRWGNGRQPNWPLMPNGNDGRVVQHSQWASVSASQKMPNYVNNQMPPPKLPGQMMPPPPHPFMEWRRNTADDQVTDGRREAVSLQLQRMKIDEKKAEEEKLLASLLQCEDQKSAICDRAGGSLHSLCAHLTSAGWPNQHPILRLGGGDDCPQKEEIFIGYNQRTRQANWVLERLDKTTVTRNWNVDRANVLFQEEQSVEPMFRASLADFKMAQKLNQNRGHLAPAMDHWSCLSALVSTHSLANVVPQNNVLNSDTGAWTLLEQSQKKAIEEGKNCPRLKCSTFVYSGPMFRTPEIQTVGKGHLAVPSHLFKVVLTDFTVESFVLKNEKWTVQMDRELSPLTEELRKIRMVESTQEPIDFRLIPGLGNSQSQQQAKLVPMKEEPFGQRFGLAQGLKLSQPRMANTMPQSAVEFWQQFGLPQDFRLGKQASAVYSCDWHTRMRSWSLEKLDMGSKAVGVGEERLVQDGPCTFTLDGPGTVGLAIDKWAREKADKNPNADLFLYSGPLHLPDCAERRKTIFSHKIGDFMSEPCKVTIPNSEQKVKHFFKVLLTMAPKGGGGREKQLAEVHAFLFPLSSVSREVAFYEAPLKLIEQFAGFRIAKELGLDDDWLKRREEEKKLDKTKEKDEIVMKMMKRREAEKKRSSRKRRLSAREEEEHGCVDRNKCKGIKHNYYKELDVFLTG